MIHSYVVPRVPGLDIDIYILMWRFIVLSQQLSGAAMVRRWVSLHPPAASMESSVRFLKPSSLGGLAHRTGGRLQEETELEIKDE